MTDRDAGRSADRSAAMPLTEHLRELRSRVFKCALAVVAGMVVGWFFYGPIFEWLTKPFLAAVEQGQAEGRDVILASTGVAQPFVMQIQIAAVTGVVLASPIWLYQLWRFVTPGLHRHERRWAFGFAAAAAPLFLAGVALAYIVLPYGLEVLLGFTPAGVENIVSIDSYLSFFLRTVLVFGVGFLVPLLFVLLNFAGVVSGRRLLSWWRWIVIGVLAFSAIATPTGDPVNLVLLAGPILVLVMTAVGICLLNDRRRARRRGSPPDYSALDDDEASPVDGIAAIDEPDTGHGTDTHRTEP